MPAILGLRSPYARVGRLVYFGRMLDKIRLHAKGVLPSDYVENLGETHPTVFDGRCCRFLRINYERLRDEVLGGATDLEALAWAEREGGLRTDEECEIWNAFMMKRGWRDVSAGLVARRTLESGLEECGIQTMFDYLDFDEGRDPLRREAWLGRTGQVIVITGVCGSGKTTLGHALANELGWLFADADEFHPPENVRKMSAGEPLNEQDRAPWLKAICDYVHLCVRDGENAVVTCSALRQSHRDQLREAGVAECFVHLDGPHEVLEKRLQSRIGHFMKPDMLDSQLASRDPVAEGLKLSIEESTPRQIELIKTWWRERGKAGI